MDGSMTLADQNLQGVCEPKPSLLGPKAITRIGCWNVRTMYECGKAAQVAKEMKENRVDILGVSESRWTGSGSVVLADGTTILYSGRKDGQHQGGVALMLNSLSAKALMEWKPVSERMVRARFYSKYSKLTVIQCYSPTNEADEAEKLNFYEQLQSEVATTPKHDVLMVIGDLNAKVGRDNTGREDHMGKHGSGEINENGELFADFCGLNGLVIGGTIFPHREIHKITWNSPDKRTKNQIDHITINSRWRTSLLDTRAFRGADIGSDHTLVVGRLRLKLRKVAKESARRKLDLDKLKDPGTQREFRLRLQNRFELLAELEAQEEETGMEDIWQSVKNIYMETGREILGYSSKKRKEWISDDTWSLVEERKELKKRMLNNTQNTPAEDLQQQYRAKDKAVKKSARQDKRNYIENKAGEAEEAAKVNDSRKLYNITRSLSGKTHQSSTTIKDRNGDVLTTIEDQLKRWAEHFSKTLNRDDPRNPPRLETNVPDLDLNSDAISRDEIRQAIKLLKNNKAPGYDDIPAELLKADIETATEVLFVLFGHIWQEEQLPGDWRKGLIVKIPKKGDTTECTNWSGITLLSVVSKVFTRIILTRIQNAVDNQLRKEQAGFRKGRSCTEQIFTLRNIIEQCMEWQASLHLNFIDFEKAFDSVHRITLWKLLRLYGVPHKIIRMIQALLGDERNNKSPTYWNQMEIDNRIRRSGLCG
ncbi:hypothetical protein ACROYT_G006197 [Oculina patagonica]